MEAAEGSPLTALNRIPGLRQLVLLTGLALAIFGINYLKGLDLFERRNVYYAMYGNVQGLAKASPLVLMRRQDVLELELPPADLSAYSAFDSGNDDGGSDGHD